MQDLNEFHAFDQTDSLKDRIDSLRKIGHVELFPIYKDFLELDLPQPILESIQKFINQKPVLIHAEENSQEAEKRLLSESSADSLEQAFQTLVFVLKVHKQTTSNTSIQGAKAKCQPNKNKMEVRAKINRVTLVLVGKERMGHVEDFHKIANLVKEQAPEITTTVLSDRPYNILRPNLVIRPTLVVSPQKLRHFRPLRGAVTQNSLLKKE